MGCFIQEPAISIISAMKDAICELHLETDQLRDRIIALENESVNQKKLIVENTTMNVFNIITGPVRSGKTTFVNRHAKNEDIVYDEFSKPVIGIKEGKHNTYWIVLDPMTITDDKYIHSLIDELKHHGQVNHIKIGVQTW